MSDSDSDLFNVDEIPNHVIISLAKLILPELQAFYYSTEGTEYFVKWDIEHKNNKVKL